MYQQPQITNWKGRTDASDGTAEYRWHQVIQPLDLSQIVEKREGKPAFSLLGFCSDEGVRRNHGRQGAAKGPVAIRSALANLPLHDHNQETQLYDAGDVLCTNGNLEAAQDTLATKVKLLLENQYTPIILGGGHEVAYGHFKGITRHKTQEKIGIINIDAHFDLRKMTPNATSGTPFRQLLDENPAFYGKFPYLCLGIQEMGNTRALFDVAHAHAVQYVLAERLHFRLIEALEYQVNAFIASRELIYLTVDMDVFAAAFAPGVSAPNATGVFPDVVLHLIRLIMGSGKVVSMDIAELNPDFDIDERTAWLAASLVYQMVKHHR